MNVVIILVAILFTSFYIIHLIETGVYKGMKRAIEDTRQSAAASKNGRGRK